MYFAVEVKQSPEIIHSAIFKEVLVSELENQLNNVYSLIDEYSLLNEQPCGWYYIKDNDCYHIYQREEVVTVSMWLFSSTEIRTNYVSTIYIVKFDESIPCFDSGVDVPPTPPGSPIDRDLDYGPYKIVLVGDQQTGKTSFIERHCSGEFIKYYEPTDGVEIYTLKFDSNHGRIGFTIWDTSSKEYTSDIYYIDLDAAMIFSEAGTCGINYWVNKIQNVDSSVPLVICNNKADLSKTKQQYYGEDRIKVYNISAKTEYNCDKPFWYLAKEITGFVDLKLI